MEHETSGEAREEIEEKTGRLVRLLEERRLGGILLGTQHNFAWITAGGANGVDLSREVGVAAVLVGADGRRWLVTNSIEMRRFLDEELAGQEVLPIEPVELPWAEGQGDPGRLAALAREALGNEAVAADWPVGGLPVLEEDVARARYRLTPAELARFRALGRDAGEVLGDVCRGLEPGLSELEIANRAASALAGRGMAVPVLLVGTDDRIAQYRHPIPTARRWQRSAMVVVCARRAGLTVALTRIVHAGPVPAELRHRTRAAAEVHARLAAATRPGTAGRDLFEAAVRAYAELGFPGEERLHHQGGAIGYLSRDWIAHPRCDEVVVPHQAFAWNPSITGTKVEETWIAPEEVIEAAEAVTGTPGWPLVEVEVGGRVYPSPDIASLGDL